MGIARLIVALSVLVATLLVGVAPALATDCSVLGWKAINQQVLGDSTHNNVDFSSIPATDGATGCPFNDLKITGQARGTGTALCDPEITMQVGTGGLLNTTNNYNWVYNLEYGTGYNKLSGYHDTKMSLGQVPCATRTNGAAGVIVIWIPNAFRATFDKDVFTHGVDGYNQNNSSSTGVLNSMGGGTWSPSAENAIDTIRVHLSAGNFQQNSTFTLWAE